MNKIVAAVLILSTVAPLSAQKISGERQAETLQLEQYRLSRDSRSPAEEERRRQAEWRQSDLVRKANKFAVLWAQFALDANVGRTFDVKLAKKLEKAFSDLQKAEGWPGR